MHAHCRPCLHTFADIRDAGPIPRVPYSSLALCLVLRGIPRAQAKDTGRTGCESPCEGRSHSILGSLIARHTRGGIHGLSP
jgi:hypothetical protein